MKPGFYSSILNLWLTFCCISLNSFAGSPDHLWAIGMTGGGSPIETYEEMYLDSQYFFEASQAFKVPKNHSFHYFGIPDAKGGGDRVYAAKTGNFDVEVSKKFVETLRFMANWIQLVDCSSKEAFLKTGGDQKDYIEEQEKFESLTRKLQNSIREVRRLRPDGRSLSDLSGTGGDDYSGFAKKENLMGSLRHVLANGKSGDHVLLHLSGHGQKLDRQKPDEAWEIILKESDLDIHSPNFGSDPESVTTTDLVPILRSLNQKGITVHLNAHACYSGGFVELTDALRETGICVTSGAPKNVVGRAGPDKMMPIFTKNMIHYGSQLRSYACSIASDRENSPITSLDEVVDSWRASQLIESKGLAETLSSRSSVDSCLHSLVSVLDSELLKDDRIQRELLRVQLLKSYEEEFSQVYEDCASNAAKRNLEKSKVKKEDIALFSEAVAKYDVCMKVISPENENPVPLEFVLMKKLASEYADSSADSTFADETMRKHKSFLKKADLKSLTQFKNAFCCLAYDPKTGLSPEVCR